MKVLFIGESWTVHMIHVKGFDSMETSYYEEGATHLLTNLKEQGIDLDYIRSHEVQVNFPNTLEELEQYDAIILSDIGSNTFLLQNQTFYEDKLRSDALGLMKEYVNNGGGLIMIGGYLSFTGIEGKANYGKTQLAEVLPVILQETDDRMEAPAGLTPKVIADDEFLKSLGEWPHFLGYNKFKEKDENDVKMEINGDPLLVIGGFGKGRVACFASDCAPHWASEKFLQWEHYTPFWVYVIEQVAGKK